MGSYALPPCAKDVYKRQGVCFPACSHVADATAGKAYHWGASQSVDRAGKIAITHRIYDVATVGSSVRGAVVERSGEGLWQLLTTVASHVATLQSLRLSVC